MTASISQVNLHFMTLPFYTKETLLAMTNTCTHISEQAVWTKQRAQVPELEGTDSSPDSNIYGGSTWDKSSNPRTHVYSFVKWREDDKTYLRGLLWEINQVKQCRSKYLEIKWAKVGEGANCLKLLTKHQTFRDPLGRVAHITSLVDLSGVK